MAQVITVETKMNVFRDLKFSISAWRADCGGRRNYRDGKENSNRLTFEKPLSNTPTSSLPVIAHVASSTCSCVTLSEMLYTTTSHSSRRSRSSSRVGDYQKRLYTQIHIVCKLSSSRGRPITSKTYIIYFKKVRVFIMQNDSFTESYLPIGLSLMHSPVGSTLLVYLVNINSHFNGVVLSIMNPIVPSWSYALYKKNSSAFYYGKKVKYLLLKWRGDRCKVA